MSFKPRLGYEAAAACEGQGGLAELAGTLDTRYVVASRLTKIGSLLLLARS